jgi:hypothetical protein
MARQQGQVPDERSDERTSTNSCAHANVLPQTARQVLHRRCRQIYPRIRVFAVRCGARTAQASLAVWLQPAAVFVPLGQVSGSSVRHAAPAW